MAFCANCGAALTQEGGFCGSCGKPVGAAHAAVATMPAVAAAPAMQPTFSVSSRESSFL